MIKCPKCGYERTENDDNFISIEECPKCGVIYKKWQMAPDSKDTEPISNVNESLSIKKEQTPIQYKSIILYATIIILLSIFVKVTFFSNDESKRLVSSLPVNPPTGMESSACLIRVSGNEGTITAAGQLFKPPPNTPVLFKLGFLFTQYEFPTRVPGLKLQVILSEWYGDRPAPAALWISEPTTLPSTNNNYQADWLDVGVPHLSLNPEKLYVAWVTLGGLANQHDAYIGIPAMGPRNSMKHGYIESPYPQGMRVLYKQENPYGDVVQMTKSAWEVGDVGHNLHFRMSFENQHKPSVEGYGSPSHLDAVIQKKTEKEILNRKEREQQTRDEIKQQQIEREEQRQVENERRQIEMATQRQAENERRQIENEKKQEENKRQQIEKEIQQYESERKKEQENKENNSTHQGAWPHRRFYPRR